jgi:hypothetical protein
MSNQLKQTVKEALRTKMAATLGLAAMCALTGCKDNSVTKEPTKTEVTQKADDKKVTTTRHPKFGTTTKRVTKSTDF